MSHKFDTTNVHAVEADHYEAKALGVAFAVIGRLVAEGVLTVNLTDKDWPVDFKNQVLMVADVIHEFAVGGF